MLDGLNPSQTKRILQGIIFIFAAFLFYTLRIFIDAFLGAVIFYVLFTPLMHYLSVKKKWKRWLSATVILIATLFVIIIPLGFIGTYVVSKLISLVGDSSMITSMVTMAEAKIKALTGQTLLTSSNIQSMSQKATGVLTDLLGTTAGILGDLIIMFFLLFYLLINSNKVLKGMEDYIPFSHENILRFGRELKGMTYANALGAPLIALVQSIAAAIGFAIFGVKEPIFWGMMCGLGSFVPAVGSAIIWVPAALILLLEGHTGQSVGFLIYAVVFIIGMENFLRIALQKRMADVHPLITILGFIIGVQLFGVPGIIFGPLLLSWFLLMLEIYKDEFLHPSGEKGKKPLP